MSEYKGGRKVNKSSIQHQYSRYNPSLHLQHNQLVDYRRGVNKFTSNRKVVGTSRDSKNFGNRYFPSGEIDQNHN